ncbi:MAG TPA: hypothetical protein VMB34_08260 [Acetobacteraceae bacterium]|nr:hypothetical protein [Acetobacteraceae bacterium]
MTDDPKRQAQELIDRLHERGHHQAADQLARHLADRPVERALLSALREACETLLTAIEAIDPVMQTMIEKLRVDVEARLRVRDKWPPAG